MIGKVILAILCAFVAIPIFDLLLAWWVVFVQRLLEEMWE